MTRYRSLRLMGLGPVSSGFVAAMNWLFGVPRGEIRIMHMTIEFDPDWQGEQT